MAPNVPKAFSVVFPVVLCVPPREAAAEETTRTWPAVLPNVLQMTTSPASDAAPGVPVLALVASPEASRRRLASPTRCTPRSASRGQAPVTWWCKNWPF